MQSEKGMRTVTIALLALFVLLVWGWETRDAVLQRRNLAKHAHVISSAVWNFDSQTPFHYLSIAAQLDNYKSASVLLAPTDKLFVRIGSDGSGRCDRAFEWIGLIRHRPLTAPVLYGGEQVGRLDVIHVNKNIYLYLYWLLVLVLVWLGANFFSQVLKGKRMLEFRVQERTHELQKSNENLRVTLDSIGDAVIATDTAGNVVGMNPVAEKITGWSLAEAAGKPLMQVFKIVDHQTHEPIADPVSQVLLDRTVVALEPHSCLISKDDEEFLIADSAAPIRNPAGEVVGAVLVFRDVTEEYAMQERLRQSEKMEVIGQLAGGIAHDFNNMLGGIFSATELLRDVVPAGGEVDRYLEIIFHSAERASGLTTKLLAFSRRNAVVFEETDVHHVIEDAVAILRSTLDRRIAIEVDLSAECSVVAGDASLLENAVLNLGVNASHSIAGAGAIKISTAIVELDAEECNKSTFELEPGPFLEIVVRDTGAGIKPEYLPRIFEPFFTTKETGKGTGLGLAATYGTVQQHKGAIMVKSKLGSGTVFSIDLPLAQATETQGAPAGGVRVSGKGTILFADDEECLRLATQMILEKLGYTVLTAEDGRQAVDLFAGRHREIDLVLLDMSMPELDGLECFAAMRKIDPDVAAILSSGSVDPADVEELKRAGLKAVIEKPFSSAVLSQLIDEILNG